MKNRIRCLSLIIIFFCSCTGRKGGVDGGAPGSLELYGPNGSQGDPETMAGPGEETPVSGMGDAPNDSPERLRGNAEGYDGIDDIPCEDNSCFFWVTRDYTCPIRNPGLGTVTEIASFRGALKLYSRRMGEPRTEIFDDACTPFNHFRSYYLQPEVSNYNPDFLGVQNRIYERRSKKYITQVHRSFLSAIGRLQWEEGTSLESPDFTEVWCRNEGARQDRGIDIIVRYFSAQGTYRASVIDARDGSNIKRMEVTDVTLESAGRVRTYGTSELRLRIGGKFGWYRNGTLQLAVEHSPIRLLCRLQVPETEYSDGYLPDKKPARELVRVWQNKSISVSFVPDGTPNGFGGKSRLFELLDSRSSYSGWKQAMAGALQKWADVAPLNFYFMNDDGSEMGVRGAAQGELRFGDIRVGTASLRADRTAFAFFPPLPGLEKTEFGDIYIERRWISQNQDLQRFNTSLMHEIGHALGLPHVDDPDAVMHPNPKVGASLSESDIKMVKRAYGSGRYAESPSQDNQTIDSASLLSWYGKALITTKAELGLPQDIDCYRFSIPRLRTLEIKVSSSGLSLLVPKIKVYHSTGELLVEVVAPKPPYEGPTAIALLASLPVRRELFACVERATAEFSVGQYKLSLELR